MALTRKLSDLFVVGKEVTVEDGKGEPVTLYLRKTTPLEAEEMFRAANAAKSRMLASKTDPESLLFQVISDRCEKATKEEIIEDLVLIETERKRLVIEAEVEAEERWSKDDYLQGLHDAWEGGLKEKHFTDPDDESKRVYSEMEEFNAQVEVRIEREKASIEKDLKSMGIQKLRDRFFDEQFDRQGDSAWVTEYRKQELYFAVRDPDDHSIKAFETPDEVNDSQPKLIQRLREEYASLAVDVLEGKD
jgi:hypothetical protein